ncbi:hypothetical protein ACHAW5_003621 [Stephanodiscus triporus]|uniref:Mitochondrial carrier protein n=1 Tax=Stephanodiscus triporus TaxID=2934178 RepID=A0ABD3PCE3_9STRA
MPGPMLSSMRATALVLLSLLLVISSPTSDASPSADVHPSTTAELFVIPRGGGGTVGSVGPVGGRARSRSPQSTTTTITTTTTTTTTTTESSSALVEGLKSTLASGLAAACSKTLLAPFDTIKTVQQHTASGPGGKGLGMIEAGRRIVSRQGGPANLYSGLAVSALGSMPSVGLYFGVYSYCKRTIGPWLIACLGDERRPRRRGVAAPPLFTDATIRNLSVACSRGRRGVVKQSLQTGQYPSTIVAMRTMWREGGMRSFFPLGGVSIQMVRDVPYAIFTLLSYEYIRENWVVVTRNDADDRPDNHRWLRDMAAGATAGGIGSYLTNPFDVVKTRLQTTGGDGGGGGYGGSIANCARAVLDEGGPTAFLRGSVPRLMHKIPANGLFFVFYEFFKRRRGKRNAMYVCPC